MNTEVNILPANRVATFGANPIRTHAAPIGIEVTTSIFLLPNLAESAPPSGAQGRLAARDVAAAMDRFLIFNSVWPQVVYCIIRVVSIPTLSLAILQQLTL